MVTHKQVYDLKMPFPKLMLCRSTEMVVLFTSEKEGMVIIDDHVYNVGHYSVNWNANDFTDLPQHITITLSNRNKVELIELGNLPEDITLSN